VQLLTNNVALRHLCTLVSIVDVHFYDAQFHSSYNPTTLGTLVLSSCYHPPCSTSPTFWQHTLHVFGNMTPSSASASALSDEAQKDSGLRDTEKMQPSTTTNPWDPNAFPDGGTEAWLVVLGAFCAMFVSFGWIGAIGVFQEHYQLNQLRNYSPSEVAWIPAVESFFMFIGGSWVGRMQDLYGPRWLLPIGTFLHVFGLMMASISKKYYQFLLSQAVCSGIGTSMIFYPAAACLATWFMKKRAAAFGLAACGSGLGGILFPVIVVRLIEDIGFAWTMRTCAFLILFLMIIACFTVKSRIPPQKTPVKATDFVKPLTEMPFLLLSLVSVLHRCC
jgi:hypothetical protein